MRRTSITKTTKNPKDQLLQIFVILMLIGSGYSIHPCAPEYPETNDDDDVNLMKNYCEFEASSIHLICSGGLDDVWNNGSNTVRILTLCRLPEESFDPEALLAKFPALKNLSIFESNLTHLTTAFPSTAKYLQILKFNGTKLEDLPEDAFSKLPILSILDLRNNVLSVINPSGLAGPSLEAVYLSGNPWKCVFEMSWILNLTDSDSVANRIVDRDKLICSFMKYDRPLIPVVKIIKELREQCLQTERCSCELSWVGRSPGATQSELLVFVTVNCSSRGFTEMPKFLPKYTNILYLSKNKIHDLSPLKINPVYKGVEDLYLDDNEVESIAILEGSDWLDQFRALSLRGNRLTDLPAYALENALQQNHGAASVFLGNNPWRCECRCTPGFQELLKRHTSLFKDMSDITCAKVENDENSEKQIIHLTRTAICTIPTDWIEPLDVLNGILAFLIFFVFGKLLYDYWTFKKTGKLPWIVAKIP